jgi:hypothetical protein
VEILKVELLTSLIDASCRGIIGTLKLYVVVVLYVLINSLIAHGRGLKSITRGVMAYDNGCTYLWLHPLCNISMSSALEC